MLTNDRPLRTGNSSTDTSPVLVFGSDLSPLSLARMIWKSKWLIALLWFALTGAAVFFIQRIPLRYQASALIILDSQKIPEKYVSSTVSTDVQERFATISQQILSSSHLKRIVDRFDLYSQLRKTRYPEQILEIMRHDIEIVPERGPAPSRSGAFRISYSGSNPVVVAQVANQIANLYVEENFKNREVQAEGTSDFIETQLAAAKKRLDDLEAAVSQYKVQHSGELPQQENTLNGMLSRLQTQLEVNRDAINRTQAAKAMLENSLSSAQDTLAAHLRMQETAGRAAARAENELAKALPPQPVTAGAGNLAPETKSPAALLRTQLESARARYSEEHPEVRRLKAQLERAERMEAEQPPVPPPQIAVAVPVLRSPIPSAAPAAQSPEVRDLRDRIGSLQSQLAVNRQEMETRKEEQQRILADTSSLQSRVTRLPIREQEMAQITRDYEASKMNYKSLLDKKIAAEMAADMERRQQAEQFSIADPAKVPNLPSRPNRMLLRVIAAVFAAGLSLPLGLLYQWRKGVFLGDWQVPKGIPVLGKLPYIAHSDQAASGTVVAGVTAILLLVGAAWPHVSSLGGDWMRHV